MRILAFDPGGTTGWASLTIWQSNSGIVHELAFGQLGPNRHHLELWELLTDMHPTHLVYESFEFRNRTRDNLELISRNYIGVIEVWADLHPTRLYSQSASQAKGFIPDKGPHRNRAIKALGWEDTSKKHSMDAVRHLIYFAVNGPHNIPGLREDILNKAFK